MMIALSSRVWHQQSHRLQEPPDSTVDNNTQAFYFCFLSNTGVNHSHEDSESMNKLYVHNSPLANNLLSDMEDLLLWIFTYCCWSLWLTMTRCSASLQDMRNLRFAHKQMEDTLRKSIFEVLMKFAFPVSNGLVSDPQPHRIPHCSSALTTNWWMSLPLSTANLRLRLRASVSRKWMEGVWLCLRIQKTGIFFLQISRYDYLAKCQRKLIRLCVFLEGYTQWKLEDLKS